MTRHWGRRVADSGGLSGKRRAVPGFRAGLPPTGTESLTYGDRQMLFLVLQRDFQRAPAVAQVNAEHAGRARRLGALCGCSSGMIWSRSYQEVSRGDAGPAAV